MKYLLLIAGDEATMNAAPTVADTGMSAEFAAFNEALFKSGAYIGGERLRPTSAASTVRVRDQKAVVIDVPDLDAAIEWAKKCPSARNGSIEVRPIWPTRNE
jgi:hypothetical protein